MKTALLVKNTLLLFVFTFLTACASSVSFVKYDAAKNPVKKIGLINVEEPVGYLAMDWGQPAGPFGAGKMNRQSKEYAELVKQSGFSLGKELNANLIGDLRAAGFQLYQGTVSREKPGELARPDAFKKSTAIDAYLDVVINYAGYTTKNVFDRDFKPDLRVRVQLISATDLSVLYSEVFMYGYHNPFMSATNLDAPKSSYFKNFDDLKSGYQKSLQGLKTGAAVTSKAIVNKLQ